MVGQKNVEFILIFLSRHFFVGVLPIALFLLSSVKLPQLVDFAHAAQTQPVPDRSLAQERRIGTRRVRAGTNTRPSLDQLADIARDEGRVHIIVGLRVPFQPEGRMTAAAVTAQRLRIAQTRAAMLSRLAPSSITGVKEFDFIPFVALAVDASGFERLRDAPERTSIEEDSLLAPSLEESAPLIGAPAAWTTGYSGAGQTVAILDSGVDKNHPFLTGKVVSEACYSTTSAQTSSVCPGGVSQSTASGSGVHCGVGGCNHGTHVAGIAAGQSAPFSGVAKDANVIAIQVFSRINGCSGSNCITAFTSDILLGMQRVQALNGTFSIAAVNLSLGGGSFGSNCDALETAFKAGVDSLRSIGIASVIASGNDGSNGGMSSPGCISTAVSVGSTGDGSGGSVVDTISSFSNSASFLNLLAPGHWINSSVPGGGFSVFSGTSMATPHVTGAWAVLKSKTPAASVGQVLQALTNTGLPVTDPRNGVVKSRVRVDQAVNALPTGACSYAISSTSQAFPLAGGSTTVNVTADNGCLWTASSNVSWINILSGDSGTGNGSVSFSVAANPLLERVGTLFIGGQTFIVSQPSIPLFAVDDGTFENATGLGAGGSSYRVNRLTPASYPATINSIAVFFAGEAGVHFGNALNIIAGTNPGGGSNINGIQFPVNLPVTVQVTDQFNIYPIPPLTINSGDFVVGIFMNHAAGVFPFSLDTGPPLNQRSYRSLNGTAFMLTDDLGLPGNYSFRAIPTQAISCQVITNVNPGSATAGTNVTITGTGFTGVSAVKFSNNVTASFNVINDTTITATVPGGATTGPITLIKSGCADVQTAPFTVIACPTVNGINPTSGIVGSSVVITGANFTGVSAITFSNGASASFNVNSATQITATVPGGAVSGPVTISKPGCSDVQTASFTVIVCPSVNGILPSSGLVGTNVVITGSAFTGVTAVKFANNVSATFSVDSPTQITVTVPAGAVSGPITISRPPCADIQTTAFTVIPCPTVNNINPTTGMVNSSVVITGSSFTGVTGVKFSNNVSASFSVDSPTQITATVPVGAVSGVITVSRPGCSDIQTALFTVITCPTVSGIDPTFGLVGSSVVITGNNFNTVSAVKFSNNVSASFVVNNAAQITATVPAGAVTGVITISRPLCSDIQTSSFEVRNPEADVAPRPNGSGSVVVSDWVQVGRFSVNLDTPTPGSEFQRADCAPRETLGDGQISVADWVQAGRYSVALDPPVPSGGPTSPSMSAPPLLNPNVTLNGADGAKVRRVRVVDTVLRRGQIGSVLIEFDAIGNENALSFTLSYDAGAGVFVDAVGEGRASTASLLVNAGRAADGRVAIALALPMGMTFGGGTQTLLAVRFLPAGGDGLTSMQVRFDDTLINREIVTWDARRMPAASFEGASVAIDGMALAVVSAASFASGTIAPESIAAAFGTGLALVTDTASAIPLPTELGGTSVTVFDSAGVEYAAPLFFVSENQVNFQIPKECELGIASVTVRSGTRVVAAGLINVVEVTPALFSVAGIAAGNVFRIGSDGQGEYEPLMEYDAANGSLTPVPIELGRVGEAVYLVIYGTGFRDRRAIREVTAKIGGMDATVAYGGPHASLIGVDQINLLVPGELAARGDVRVEVSVDGKMANVVSVRVN